jgi:TonB family protein
MRKIFLTALIILKVFLSYGQIDTNISKKNAIRNNEVKAEFAGGKIKLMNFLRDNILYPQKAMQQGLEGTATVEFVICEDGTICNAQAVRGHPLLIKEALKVINKMPKWQPGMQNGVAVPSYLTLPVTFEMEDDGVFNTAPESILELSNKILRNSNAEFIGGQKEFLNFLIDNIQYPTNELDKIVEGLSIINFEINTDGIASDFKIETAGGPQFDKEALRVLQSIPKWSPRMIKGKKVASRINVPITFEINKDLKDIASNNGYFYYGGQDEYAKLFSNDSTRNYYHNLISTKLSENYFGDFLFELEIGDTDNIENIQATKIVRLNEKINGKLVLAKNEPDRIETDYELELASNKLMTLLPKPYSAVRENKKVRSKIFLPVFERLEMREVIEQDDKIVLRKKRLNEIDSVISKIVYVQNNHTSAEFPGGQEALSKFIFNNMNRLKSNSSETIFVTFEVDANGVIGNINTSTNNCLYCRATAGKLVAMMPKWVPATKNGDPVKSTVTIPFSFTY